MYNNEILGVLKELSSNQSKINDKIEKLLSRVDSLYETPVYEYEESDFEYTDARDDEGSFETFHFKNLHAKKQKMDESIFKNISEKFNPKEVMDSEINDGLAQFVNNTFRDGISEERQAEII